MDSAERRLRNIQDDRDRIPSPESISRYEEIQQACIVIALFSSIDRSLNTFENFSTIIKNGLTIHDETSQRHVEEGYGQLNISDIFNQPDFILTSANYTFNRLDQELTLLPNIYVIKTRYEDSLLMMLLLSPWGDLNVTELHEAANLLCMKFNGVYRRGSMDVANKKIAIKDRRAQCEKANRILLQELYHQIFSERSIRGTSGKMHKASNLVAILFQEGELSTLTQCLGECGHVFRPENIQGIKCPNCSGELGTAPPVFQPKHIAIAYPNEFLKFEAQNIRSYLPIDLFFLYQATDLPSQIRLVLNRINRRIFKSSLPYFERAIFSLVDGHEFLYLYNVSTQKDDRILMVTAICDSRFQETGTLPTMTIHALVRAFSEGKITEYDTKKLTFYPIFDSWNFSDWIGVGPKSMQWEQLLSWEMLSNYSHDLNTFLMENSLQKRIRV